MLECNAQPVVLVRIYLVRYVRAHFFLFLAYSGLVYAAGRKKNEKKTH